MREIAPFAVAIVAITGWMVITVTRIIARNRVREMQIRERIALIEKGLVPPPEVDPAGFERVMGRHEGDLWQSRPSTGRHLRAGIVLLAVGFGVMLLVSTASQSLRIGIGPGGLIMALGLAFVLIHLFEPPPLRPPTPPGPPASPEPRRPD